MDQTPKHTKKDKDKDKAKKKKKKDKEKSHTEYIDLSCSPTASSSTTLSRVSLKKPVTPSRDQSSTSSTTRGEKSTTSKSTYRSNDYDPFTYNSRPLPVFSSNNPVDPPRAGANAGSSRTIPSTAATQRSGANDLERSSYGDKCKVKTLEMCLSLKDQYLAMLPAARADPEPFWGRVLEMLELMPLTKGKFKEWKELHRAVESWCQARRSSMRENRLPAVSQSHPELDSLIDEWNLVFAQRFCKIHSGYFANTIWPQFAEQKLKKVVKEEVDSWISKSLRDRRNELQRFVGPTLLSSNSSLTDYDNAVKGLQNQINTAQRDDIQVRESEAVMSMVLKLQPGLRTAISQFLESPAESTGGSQQSSDFAGSRERISFTIPSTGASVRTTTSAPPAPSTFRTPQTVPGLSASSAHPTTTTNPIQRMDRPNSQLPHNSPSTQPSEKSGEDVSRKRKDPELPTRTTTSSSNSNTGGDSIGTMPNEHSKRQRLDLPPAAELKLKGTDTRDTRPPPWRRPLLPQRPATSYRHTQNEGRGHQGNPNKPPLPAASPARPSSPPWTRSAPPGYRNDSYHNSGGSHPRYRDQHRYRGVDSYRPPPRTMRETTVEFQGMTLQQQNMSLLRQIKEVQSMVDKKNGN